MLKNIRNLFYDLDKILCILFILIIPFLISGPFIPETLLSICILIYLYINFKKKNFYYLNNIYIKIFFLWCAYLLFTSLISDYVLLSLESSLFYFRFIFIILIISYLADNYKYFYKYLLTILIMSYSILFLDSLIQYFNGENILGFAYNGKRLSSLFGDELVMGGYIARFLPMVLALLFYIYNDKAGPKIFILITASAILVALSGERTAIFLFLIIFLVFLIFIRNQLYLKLILTFSSVFIFAIILLNNNLLKERLIDHTYNQFSKLHTEKLVIFSKYHQYNLIISKNIFLDNIVFGIGPKNYREECKLYEIDNYCKICTCSMHPHNYLSQVLSEVGILGALAFLILFIYFIYQLIKYLFYSYFYKESNNINYKLCLCLSAVINLFIFVPSGNLFNNWISIIIYINLSLGIYEFLLKHKNTNITKYRE